MLKNKKILLAVCGSISFYKAYEILRELQRNGADVYVALSDGVLKFCSVTGWEALTPHPILCSQTENWQGGVSHIEYAKMDLVLIAPASANTINKLANGVCDNVFMQTLIASDAPLLIAPAANNKMLEHFATKRSFEFLKSCGVNFIDPVTKILACKDVGKGALADIKTIIYEVKKALSEQIFKDKTVVITGGATSEKIDDVRAVTNFSSGKTAKALADAFYFAGANVKLIASFECQNLPYETIKFQSSSELNLALKENLKGANLLVMAAAVSDYKPKEKFDGKLKKENLGEEWSLNLTKNIDILGSLGEFKDVKKIGFKMEMDSKNALKNAKNMLKSKNLDAVCLNVLNEKVNFGSDVSKITFIANSFNKEFELGSKQEIAKQIVKAASNL